MKKYSMNDAAQKFFGWQGKHRGEKLARKVIAKEKKTGKPLIIRTSPADGQVMYWVTEEVLRGEFPELFASVTVDAVGELSRVVTGIKTRIDEIVESKIDSKLKCHQNNDIEQIFRKLRVIDKRLQALELKN